MKKMTMIVVLLAGSMSFAAPMKKNFSTPVANSEPPAPLPCSHRMNTDLFANTTSKAPVAKTAAKTEGRDGGQKSR